MRASRCTALLLALAVAAELTLCSAAEPGFAKLGRLMKSTQQKLDEVKRRHRRDTTVNACSGAETETSQNEYTDYASCVTYWNKQKKTALELGGSFPSDDCPVKFETLACALEDPEAKDFSAKNEAASDAVDNMIKGTVNQAYANGQMQAMCDIAPAGLSKYLSPIATIAANPESCAWYHTQVDFTATEQDSDIGETFTGPALGAKRAIAAKSTSGYINLKCGAGLAVDVQGVFHGSRSDGDGDGASGAPTCFQEHTQAYLENECDDKNRCLIDVSALCQTGCATNSLEIEFDCTTGRNMYADASALDEVVEGFTEYVCAKDASGTYCPVAVNAASISESGIDFTTEHGIFDFSVDGHPPGLDLAWCTKVKNSNSCCFASFFDAEKGDGSKSPLHDAHWKTTIHGGLINRCSALGVDISAVLGIWDTEDEHCGGANAKHSGTEGEAPDIDNDMSDSSASGPGAAAAAMLMATTAVLVLA